jgi:putative FmdB family regulatory protein
MPRYSYRCTVCEQTSTVQHLSSETLSDCSDCKEEGTMVKLLNRFTTAPKKNLRKKVGQVTEEFIADAREDLKQQKKTQEEKP